MSVASPELWLSLVNALKVLNHPEGTVQAVKEALGHQDLRYCNLNSKKTGVLIVADQLSLVKALSSGEDSDK